MPPREAAGLKIPCPTPNHLQTELDALAAVLEPPEREDTWEKMEKGIVRFAGVTRGGGYKHLDLFVRGVGIKGVGLRIAECMVSDRGRLSGVSTDLLQTMAPRLASHFHPLVPVYLPPLVRLLARPNKVFFKRAEKCLATIIQHCPLPSVVVHLSHALDDRSDQCKRAAAIGIESAMGHWDLHRWSQKDLDLLELCVRKMATDRDGEVRKTARRVWALFSELWPERVEEFTTPLTPTIRRYLDIPPDEGPSKPKPRLGLRPRPQSTQSDTEASSRPHVPAPPSHGIGAPRTRSASRNLRVEARTRVVSESGMERPSSHLSRSSSLKVLSNASSSSSSLSRSESSRQHVLSKPSRPGQHSRDGELASTSRRMPPPSRTVSQSSDRPEDDRRPTRSAFVPRPAMRPLRQAVSAESITYASASAAVPASDPPSQPSSSKSKVKERISELEKKAEVNGTPTAFRQSSSRQDLARAAAMPLPDDSPLVSKSTLPPSQAPPLPDSPSFAMLLNRSAHANDVPEMPSLLDLSLADMTITAHADTPGPVSRRRLSHSLREAAPSPGSVAQLIGRFSRSSSETPGKMTPTRSNTSLSGTESAPTTIISRQTSKTSPLSAESTGSSSSTPGFRGQRRISPLPRRASVHVSSPEAGPEDSPSHPLKRKGSDIERSFAQSTPVPRSKVAPRFSQPLIAFGDTPTRRQSLSPFVFGERNAGFFDDLMGIQNGDSGDDGEVVHEGFTQLLEGLVVDDAVADEPASLDGLDLLGLPVPTALPPALVPESTGATADLLDFDTSLAQDGHERAESEVASAEETENDATVVEPESAETESADVTIIAASAAPVEEPSDAESSDADVTATAAVPEEHSASETEDADTTVRMIASPALDEPTAAPVQASPVQVPTSDFSFDVAKLTQSMAAATLASPAPAQSPFRAAEALPPPSTTSNSSVTPTPGTPAVVAEPKAATPARAAPVAAVSDPTPRPAKQEQPEVKAKEQPTVQAEEVPEENAEEKAAAPVDTAASSASQVPVPGPEEPIPAVPPTVVAPAQPMPSFASFPTQPPVAGPPRTRGHMRSTTAPVRPTAASSRLGPPSKAARLAPGERKSFKPVSRLGMAESGKSAPAPARLAMATKTSQAKVAKAAPAPARKAAPAPAPEAVSSAPASKPPSRAPSRAHRAVSRQASRAASPMPEPEPPKAAQPSTSNTTAAPKQPSRPGSSLLKPTAAAAARAAATVVTTKDKEPAKEVGPNRPTAASRPPASRVVSASRPASSLFAPTAASRARAEPALPPSKRQRVKLKAPMESFKPGRARTNPSKTAVLGQASQRPRGREARAAKKSDKVETFPLPGPKLESTADEETVEVTTPAASTEDLEAEELTPSLGVPAPLPDDTSSDGGLARTPTALSPLASSAALSPASSRHTDRSYDSSMSSPRKMRPSPSRPLEPVLTPLHSTLSGSSDKATPARPGQETPATMHARRISGIPASVQRSSSTSREREYAAVSEDADGEKEEDGVTNVVRHDVSTPQGKASSLLAKFGTERRALTPRDGNKD